MKQKLPTLAGLLVALCLMAGCSFSKHDRRESCYVECAKCENLRFHCSNDSKGDEMDAGNPVVKVISKI